MADPKAPSYPQASSPGRAANMRAIRRTDTKPELALRRALHRMGYRFRKDHRLDSRHRFASRNKLAPRSAKTVS